MHALDKAMLVLLIGSVGTAALTSMTRPGATIIVFPPTPEVSVRDTELQNVFLRIVTLVWPCGVMPPSYL